MQNDEGFSIIFLITKRIECLPFFLKIIIIVLLKIVAFIWKLQSMIVSE